MTRRAECARTGEGNDRSHPAAQAGRGRPAPGPRPAPGVAALEALPAGRSAAVRSDLSAVLDAARDGDDEAFRLLYRSVQPLLLRYLRALVNPDAEDVASETWLQIVRDLHSFRGDYDGFRGWSATIARHRALDHVR